MSTMDNSLTHKNAAVVLGIDPISGNDESILVLPNDSAPVHASIDMDVITNGDNDDEVKNSSPGRAKYCGCLMNCFCCLPGNDESNLNIPNDDDPVSPFIITDTIANSDNDEVNNSSNENIERCSCLVKCGCYVAGLKLMERCSKCCCCVAGIKVINWCRRKTPIFKRIKDVIGLALHVIDLATDIYSAVQFYINGHIWWATMTVVFTVLPMLVTSMLGIASYIGDCIRGEHSIGTTCLWVLGIIVCSPFIVIGSLVGGVYQTWFPDEDDDDDDWC
ncbi:unnamed protein product [Meganyctiphanes norvegica]|uniref:XK-related protein n=1 Tax=Meganyctiphanes norvegica TaxID=48144 RepID=A0AAV2Q015_MEGNR